MRPRVFAFVEDPGAANGVLGLAVALAERGVALTVAAAEPAAGWLRAQGEGADVVVADGEDPARLLDAHRCELLLVGTSENPRSTGLGLVDAARRRDLASVGFVDAYANAAHRFRGATDAPLAHVPDDLVVPDEWTRDAFVALGVDAARVHVTGHPHDDDVLARRASFEGEGVAAVRARALPGAHAAAARGRRVVVFAAEIATGLDPAQFRRGPDHTLVGRGDRDDRTGIVLQEVLDALRAPAMPPTHFVLRMHPKNDLADFGPLLDEVDEVSRGGSALEVAFAAEVVVGMTSMFLLEARLLGVPVLSVVPRPLEADWLPTVRAGLTPCAFRRQDVRGGLEDALRRTDGPLAAYTAPGARARLADRLAALAGVRR